VRSQVQVSSKFSIASQTEKIGSSRSVSEMSSKCLVALVFVVAIAIVNASLRVKRLSRDQCGEPLTPGGLVFHGTIAKRDKWPFLAALFNTNTEKFFCGGSLITSKNILTAAHCLQDKNVAVAKSPAEVIAFLGRYDLNVSHERDAVAAYPVDFIIHPDWKPFDSSFDADIAIIKLSQDVPLRQNIFPVCLWSPELRNFKDDDGTVVGW
jgi:Trypsin